MEKVLGAIAVLAAALLLFLWDTVLDSLPQVLRTSAQALGRVDSVLGVVGGTLRNFPRVARSRWISCLKGVAGHVMKVATSNGLDVISLIAELLLEVVAVEVGGIVPLMFGGGVVDLAQLLLRGRHTVGGFACNVASHIAKDDDGIVKKLAELSTEK